jgi:hypothetical protein
VKCFSSHCALIRYLEREVADKTRGSALIIEARDIEPTFNFSDQALRELTGVGRNPDSGFFKGGGRRI